MAAHRKMKECGQKHWKVARRVLTSSAAPTFATSADYGDGWQPYPASCNSEGARVWCVALSRRRVLRVRGSS